jgi:signal transduction histidine kinase
MTAMNHDIGNHDSSAQLRNVNLLVRFMVGVFIVLLVGFARYSWVTEQEYEIGKFSSLLRYAVQSCEMHFQYIEKQHRILGNELLQKHQRISADKAINMLNNYKEISRDQRWFALLSGNGELIAETDIILNGQRPYFLSEIPSQNEPGGSLESERLEFERPEEGIFDVGLVMPFRFAIRDQRGVLRYIVRSRLTVGSLRDIWRTSLVPQESTIGLIHDTGYLISRYSVNPGIKPENQFAQADAAALDSYMKTGEFPHKGFVMINHAATDSEMLVVYQRLVPYRVTAFISIPVSFIRTGWWVRTRVPFALAIIVLVGGLMIYRLIVMKYRTERLFYRKQEELKDIAQGILIAQEQERGRISHELHDEIGQSLTALKIMLNRVRQSLPDQGKADALLLSGQQVLEEMVGNVREIAYRLRPSELDQLGLPAALRSHIDRVIRPVFQNVQFFENIDQRRFRGDLELCCFRVVQEALTNCLRHAQATRIDISLICDSSRLTLAVKDNGMGFDVEKYHSAQISASSLGLVGMRERVTANGGQLHIQALPEGGVEVKAIFDEVEEV